MNAAASRGVCGSSVAANGADKAAAPAVCSVCAGLPVPATDNVPKPVRRARPAPRPAPAHPGAPRGPQGPVRVRAALQGLPPRRDAAPVPHARRARRHALLQETHGTHGFYRFRSPLPSAARSGMEACFLVQIDTVPTPISHRERDRGAMLVLRTRGTQPTLKTWLVLLTFYGRNEVMSLPLRRHAVLGS